jgi:sugar/nucleoside kinase (ribokinase family)
VTARTISFRRKRPQVLGLGLIALDVIVSEGVPPLYLAGGTCGNVLAILGFLGWNSIPVARIGRDRPAGIVKADLDRWGIDLSLLNLLPTAKTPIIIQRIRKDADGIPYHTFSWHCPGCGARLPGFQPVPAKSIEPASQQLKETDVLFVDRASPSSVALARKASERGTIVFFEPPSISDDRNFRAMIECASILKYSHDRIGEIETSGPRLLLEIQTMGRGGLRFRSRLADFGKRWHHLEAHPVSQLVDSAGAGDWLSVGLIASTCRDGEEKFSKLSRKNLLSGLTLGQSLASWNCGFAGARGGMYSDRLSEIRDLMKQHRSQATTNLQPSEVQQDSWGFSYICESCRDSQDAGWVRGGTTATAGKV